MLITRKQLANLKLSFDSGSVDIYVDNGEDNEPTSLIYWISDEWTEDNEVILSVFNAIQLYHTDKVKLLELVGYEVEKETSTIDNNLANNCTLSKYGICVSNDEMGYDEVQKIDDIETYATEMNMDFIPIQIKSDNDAKIIYKHLKNFESDRVLTLKEYAEKIGVPTDELDDNFLLSDIQDYANEFMDWSIFDYPLDEIEYVLSEINENVVLVYAYDMIRVCEV